MISLLSLYRKYFSHNILCQPCVIINYLEIILLNNANRQKDNNMIIILAAACALACYKWGAWRRWREYYSTILFLIIGDMAYNFIFYDHSLWCYNGFFGHTISNFIAMFFVFPSATILFLTHWPQNWLRQALYVLALSAGFTVFEYTALILNMFTHDNGWNIFWSFGVYVLGLFFARLHFRHPLLVWPICAAFAIATMFFFGLPFCQLK